VSRYTDDEGFEGVEFDTPVGSFRAGRGTAGQGDQEDINFRRARRRVRRVMRFYRHISTFVTVILGLLAIDIIFDSDDFWVHWIALIWGIILLVHFLNAFVFDAVLGREAEQRMIDRELRHRGDN